MVGIWWQMYYNRSENEFKWEVVCMKLIYAIVRSTDGNAVVQSLNQKGFSVTKLATTGGFLRTGNTTLIIGTDTNRVDEAIAIIKSVCGPRQRVNVNSSMMDGVISGSVGAVSVDVGGATIFVMDVEKFEKI